jgi:hypothetical protein
MPGLIPDAARSPNPWHWSAGLAVKDSTGFGTFG